jgi:hypothetical protein
MDTSLNLIRQKIAELEAKIADLRVAERELLSLEGTPVATPRRTPGPKPKREPAPKSPAPKGEAKPRQTIGSAIAAVLGEHGPLPVADIADRIKEGGRDIDRRSVSYSLQAMKKQGLVKSADGKWMLPKGKAKAASA